MTAMTHEPQSWCGPYLTRCGLRHPVGSVPFGWWDASDMPAAFSQCIADCGCAGGQPANTCHFEPPCPRCKENA